MPELDQQEHGFTIWCYSRDHSPSSTNYALEFDVGSVGTVATWDKVHLEMGKY